MINGWCPSPKLVTPGIISGPCPGPRPHIALDMPLLPALFQNILVLAIYRFLLRNTNSWLFRPILRINLLILIKIYFKLFKLFKDCIQLRIWTLIMRFRDSRLAHNRFVCDWMAMGSVSGVLCADIPAIAGSLPMQCHRSDVCNESDSLCMTCKIDCTTSPLLIASQIMPINISIVFSGISTNENLTRMPLWISMVPHGPTHTLLHPTF